MNNAAQMNASFEREKNLKAGAITLVVCGGLLLLFILLNWSPPVVAPPPVTEGIEVNLGNGETGTGDVEPMIPGEAAMANQTNMPSAPSGQTATEQQDNTASADNADAVPVNTTPPKPVAKNKITHVKVIAPPTLKPPVPRAVFGGGNKNGKGGNNADSYNGSNSKGIVGGQGVQGNPNGNPNSDSYSGNSSRGNGTSSGVSIRSGLARRKVLRLPSFQDDFNENAKVAVDITVDKSGNVIDAVINPYGTTTTNPQIRAIAISKAKQLKLNSGDDDEQTGTILFNFKVTN